MITEVDDLGHVWIFNVIQQHLQSLCEITELYGLIFTDLYRAVRYPLLYYLLLLKLSAALKIKDTEIVAYSQIFIKKQVDILISKNQALQILYLKHCVYKTTYRIASNYGQSRTNAWSHLVAGGNSIITKINTRSQINARSFVGPQ